MSDGEDDCFVLIQGYYLSDGPLVFEVYGRCDLQVHDTIMLKISFSCLQFVVSGSGLIKNCVSLTKQRYLDKKANNSWSFSNVL